MSTFKPGHVTHFLSLFLLVGTRESLKGRKLSRDPLIRKERKSMHGGHHFPLSSPRVCG